MHVEEGRLLVNRASGELAGGQVLGDLSWDFAAKPPGIEARLDFVRAHVESTRPPHARWHPHDRCRDLDHLARHDPGNQRAAVTALAVYEAIESDLDTGTSIAAWPSGPSRCQRTQVSCTTSSASASEPSMR